MHFYVVPVKAIEKKSKHVLQNSHVQLLVCGFLSGRSILALNDAETPPPALDWSDTQDGGWKHCVLCVLRRGMDWLELYCRFCSAKFAPKQLDLTICEPWLETWILMLLCPRRMNPTVFCMAGSSFSGNQTSRVNDWIHACTNWSTQPSFSRRAPSPKAPLVQSFHRDFDVNYSVIYPKYTWWNLHTTWCLTAKMCYKLKDIYFE